jgi:hypothetical protein
MDIDVLSFSNKLLKPTKKQLAFARSSQILANYFIAA